MLRGLQRNSFTLKDGHKKLYFLNFVQQKLRPTGRTNKYPNLEVVMNINDISRFSSTIK